MGSILCDGGLSPYTAGFDEVVGGLGWVRGSPFPEIVLAAGKLIGGVGEGAGRGGRW